MPSLFEGTLPYGSEASVGERLDRLAWTPFHTRVTLALGVGWLLDAFEVNIIGNVLGVLPRWSQCG